MYIQFSVYIFVVKNFCASCTATDYPVYYNENKRPEGLTLCRYPKQSFGIQKVCIKN